MENLANCPVCNGAFGQCRELSTTADARAFACDGCGQFELSRTALDTWFEPGRPRMTVMQRAALSHALRSASTGSEAVMVTTDWIEAFVRDAHLPNSLPLQAINLIVRIGNAVAESGEGYFIDDVVDAPLIGAFNRAMFIDLLQELITRGLVKRLGQASIANPRNVGMVSGYSYGLTLDGWERFDDEKRGHFSGKYGFIAMKFGDPTLDPFIDNIVKPAVRDAIGYDLVDLRNVSKAGLIDDILRTQIRDAAFVLVDLTHDNSGAYWEAGYAEGLGKPVIYLCEQNKFDAAKTHFDTNHCTTVMWTVADPKRFLDGLIATLRRSLNLFPNRGETAR